MTACDIDIHTLSGLLTAPRLPSFNKLWPNIAARAKTLAWPGVEGWRTLIVRSRGGFAVSEYGCYDRL